MAEEKPGLLKRIFSFGFGRRKEEPETPEPEAETAGLPAPDSSELEAPVSGVTVSGTLAGETPVEASAGHPAPSTEAPQGKMPQSRAGRKQSARTERSTASKPRKHAPDTPAEELSKAAKPSIKPASGANGKSIGKLGGQTSSSLALEPEVADGRQVATGEPKKKVAGGKPEVEEPGESAGTGLSPGGIGEPPAERQRVPVMERRKKPETQPATVGEERKGGWLMRLTRGLSRSSQALSQNITQVFTNRKLDESTLQELEDVLIQADLGVETAMKITGALADRKYGKEVGENEVREVMAGEIERILEPVAQDLELDLRHKPHVILVVGVNGSGKTTTIGKLASKLYGAGFATTLVAGDTFRAAAIEQLKIWGERTQSPVISREIGADAAGLAFDAWQQARDEKRDVLLMDTAGRLQNKKELMAELEKIVRVLKKQDPEAPHTVLLTLDATTGQNALNQVEIFRDVAGVNGIVMTKLDGTARGGILVAIAAKYRLPVYFVGVGEQVDDLEPFEARDFARSIAGLPSMSATGEN